MRVSRDNAPDTRTCIVAFNGNVTVAGQGQSDVLNSDKIDKYFLSVYLFLFVCSCSLSVFFPLMTISIYRAIKNSKHQWKL